MNLRPLGVAVLALIALMGIVHQWGPSEGIPLWRYVAVLFLCGLIYEWRNIRGAKLSVTAEPIYQFRLGRTEPLAFGVLNGGSRSRTLLCAPGLPLDITVDEEDLVLNIDCSEKADIELPVTAKDVGDFPWTRVPAQVSGPLGLAWWPYKLEVNARLSVVPDLLGAAQHARGGIQLGDQSVHPGSGLELHHLREYVPGDPRRTIDWKATARSQKLVTRVFVEEQHLNVMLVLDVGRTSRTLVDGMSQFAHYTNLAARFTQIAVAHGDHVGLVAAADKQLVALAPQRGSRAVAQINLALRNLQSAPVETDILGAALLVQQLVRKRCLIIFFTDLYGQALTGNFGRSLKLWKNRHLPFIVSLIGSDVIAMSDSDAHEETDAYASLAATEYYSSVLANAEAARRMGAQALVARPAELQSRVIAEYQQLKLQRRV